MNFTLAEQLARKYVNRYFAYKDDIISTAHLAAVEAHNAIETGEYVVTDAEHRLRYENTFISGRLKNYVRDFIIKPVTHEPVFGDDYPDREKEELPDIQFEAKEDEDIVELILQGYNFAEIAEKLGMSRSYLWRRRMEMGKQYGKSMGRELPSRPVKSPTKPDGPKTV
jgi:hypothetical protein